MKYSISVTLIFVLALMVTNEALSQQVQDHPFGLSLVESEQDDLYEHASNIILETEDISKAKDKLYQMMVTGLVARDDFPAISSLLSRGEDLSFRDSSDNTLLHVAASHGSNRTMKLLAESGLELDANNSQGNSPLFWAAKHNQHKTVKQLLDLGADVNGNSQRNSPLNVASQNGYIEVVLPLLESKADVSIRDAKGNTALHLAVDQGHPVVVEHLLIYDADKLAKNDDGKTPKQIAVERQKATAPNPKNKRAWGTEQLIGEPNASAGDDQNAWASLSQNGQAEWIVVDFEKETVPKHVEIYENLGPKAVYQVTVFDAKGLEHDAWEGEDPAQPNEKGVHVAKIKLDTDIKTKRLKIYIDSVRVDNWNEIDAIGLIDGDGNKQWVTSATASSCYAQSSNQPQNHKVILKLFEEYR